ncbi:hypothetical protein CspeluHIS016_0602730 [Cutaneotrichosporon spelunceum]|uniref:MutL C-terminal dimerisation domain-containing protein n=1 Tax=Cutaneotrichosporon spelunceum TaxID=1672016 RepID=A0AAD3TYE9_9TREE|nr:hypothetical protein CspeluHIS016_0602730 [Cutaneotrichosporon spelunceum]
MMPEVKASLGVHDSVAVDDTEMVSVEPTAMQAATAPTPASTSSSPAAEQTDLQREAVHTEVDDEPISDGYRDEIQTAAPTGHATLRFDLERIQERFIARRRRQAVRKVSGRDAFSTLRGGAATKAAGVSNRNAESAEEALARVVSKADFSRMEILGQFNKGFIITRLKGHVDEEGAVAESDDLFIIDQHASDEKYNFETLQRTTVIKSQALIQPRAMELTAADELVAMENLDALKANGFEVAINEDAPPGRGERVSLRAMPISKETTFDFHDLEQLLHMLSDSSRPEGQMLVRNMGTIDQPWVRYLAQLSLTTELSPWKAHHAAPLDGFGHKLSEIGF